MTLIKQEDAIEVVHKHFVDAFDDLPTETDEDGDVIYKDTKSVNELLKHNKAISKELMALPSAEAEHGHGDGQWFDLTDALTVKRDKWIPCSERLPEEHEWIGTKKFGTTISDEVYVTFESPKGERFCKHLSFQNGELSRHDQLTIDAFHKGSKPIAWMPLPKPYREDSEK